METSHFNPLPLDVKQRNTVNIKSLMILNNVKQKKNQTKQIDQKDKTGVFSRKSKC